MSGPVDQADVALDEKDAPGTERVVELTASRATLVGDIEVRRALPQRARRSVGAWCFADHLGPASFAAGAGPDIGPHPHMGLATVTWLVTGELVHRDSLGSEQAIRPGQLNLMTAGRGVTHAEEADRAFAGEFHGIQLWVAQPEATRRGDPAFEHHAALPQLGLSNARATVLVGSFGDVSSPARHDTELVGVELALRRGACELPLRGDFEYGLIVLDGAVELEAVRLEPGHLAYLGEGREVCELRAESPARAMLLGGVPLEEELLMWWNFVARDRDEVNAAFHHWQNDDGWFGRVDSRLERIPARPPPWTSSR